MLLLLSVAAHAQLEKVIVERYYVSDANDATDEWGGTLETGSVTYRIYLDMLPGSMLKSIYGDAAHPFEISSSELFFNNMADGQSFAKDFIRNRYTENTVALDTWLTLGQTTRLQGQMVYYGVLKDQDDNGSFIGGINNDGGSAMIPGGLLVNEDPSAGIPLTLSDGMDTMTTVPSDWFSFGIIDFVTGEDTTMFGSVNQRSFYRSHNFKLSGSGVRGVIPDSNQVLIAQLTTKGELSFVLNAEISFFQEGVEVTKKYVGTNSISDASEVFNPFLVYPFVCGCNDPEYAEYDPEAACLEPGFCIHPVVYGCLDPTACNYDPLANYEIPGLCCYPGYCNGRDIEKVCPHLKGMSFDFEIYPNPAGEYITLNIVSGVSTEFHYSIVNAYGVEVFGKRIDDSPLNYIETIDITALSRGIYQMILRSDLGIQSELMVKL